MYANLTNCSTRAWSRRFSGTLGAWHDPPAGLSPPGAPGPYTYEPCDDVDPTPDYENVLTD
ncbi:MAG: hypothetical protein WCQ21_10635 [Verrucomicrobiota bacterium]